MNEKQKADSDEYVYLTKQVEVESRKKRDCDKNLNYLFRKIEELDAEGDLNYEYITNLIEHERQNALRKMAQKLSSVA